MCTTCRATVDVLIRMFRDEGGELNGSNRTTIAKEIALELCDRYDIEPQDVCESAFDLNWVR